MALVDSGLRNLSFGDADAVGYFQMRVSIWNQGAYAGFPENPELQIPWFLDQATAVRAARIAAGDATFGSDPLSWGESDCGGATTCGAIPWPLPAAPYGRPKVARSCMRRVRHNQAIFFWMSVMKSID